MKKAVRSKLFFCLAGSLLLAARVLGLHCDREEAVVFELKALSLWNQLSLSSKPLAMLNESYGGLLPFQTC